MKQVEKWSNVLNTVSNPEIMIQEFGGFKSIDSLDHFGQCLK